MLRVFFIFIICSALTFSYSVIGSYYGSKINDLINPAGVKIDESGNFYLLDFTKGKLVVYDKEKKLKYRVDSLKNPSFLSIIEEKIYITSTNYDKIEIFNKKDGKKIGEFGKKGMKQMEFNHPAGVYFFKNEIYVVDEQNFRIQILDKENSFSREILLPKFKYVFTSEYDSNYDLQFRGKEMLLLDRYNKKLYTYELTEKKYTLKEEVVNLDFISNPVKIYFVGQELFVYDGYNRKFFILDEKFEKKGEIEVTKEKNLSVLSFFNSDLYEEKFYYILDKKLNLFSLKEKKGETIISFEEIADGEYSEPVELREDSKKNLYILDKKLAKIIVYDKNGEFIKKIEKIGKNPTGFDIDENDNIYLAVAGENMIKKYNSNGDFIYRYGRYGVFNTSYAGYYEKLSDEEKDKSIEKERYKLEKDKIYSLKIDVDSKGYVYVLDSSQKNIKVFDQSFKFVYETGKKAGIFNVFTNKKEKDAFGWDETNDDTLKNMTVYGNDLYVVDNYYKRINKFTNGKLTGTLEDKFSKELGNIYIKDDVMYITDSLNFKVLKYDMKFKKLGEISFLDKGIIPLYYYGSYMIGKEYNTDYDFAYKVYTFEEKKNDKNKKPEGNTKKQKNTRGNRSGNK